MAETQKRSRTAPPAALAETLAGGAPSKPAPKLGAKKTRPAKEIEENTNVPGDVEDRFNDADPYTMVWYRGFKHYFQNGKVYDVVYKTCLHDPTK